MSDDLFDELDPTPDDNPSPTPPAKPAAPRANGDSSVDLERILGPIAEGLQRLNSRMDQFESRIDDVRQPARDIQNNDVLAELMADPDKFLTSRMSGVVDGQLKQLVPFLETIADGATTSARDRVRQHFESDFGDGAFEALVGEDLDKALAELPPASRANPQTIQALTAGILGGRMMSDDGRKQVAETVRKSREARRQPAPELLNGNRSRSMVPRDRVTDDERNAIESLKRSGIDFSEQAFLTAKKAGNNEEDWGADWGKSADYWNEPDDTPADTTDDLAGAA